MTSKIGYPALMFALAPGRVGLRVGRGVRPNVPSPLWGGTGWGDRRTSEVGVPPAPNPSPQGGGESAQRLGRGCALP
jgi:hypothetical protein